MVASSTVSAVHKSRQLYSPIDGNLQCRWSRQRGGDGGGPSASRQARMQTTEQTEVWSKSGSCLHGRRDPAASAGGGSDPIPGLAVGSAPVKLSTARQRGVGRSRLPGVQVMPTTS